MSWLTEPFDLPPRALAGTSDAEIQIIKIDEKVPNAVFSLLTYDFDNF